MSSIEVHSVPIRDGDLHSPEADGPRSLSGKEIKRAQNRLAQRTYRRRLKAKLEELQEKVKIHEQQLEDTSRIQSCGLSLASTASSTVVDPMSQTLATAHDSALGIDLFTRSDDIESGNYPSHHVEIVDDTPTFLSINDLSTTFSPNAPSGAWKTPHHSGELQDPTNPVPSCSVISAETVFGLDTELCSPHGHHDPDLRKGDQQRLSEAIAKGERDVAKLGVDAAAPIQDRVRYVMDHAAAVGFGTLDEAIAAYYAEPFDDTSSLYQDQRLSRNRRLPRLLSTLHDAAKYWSDWEQRGFQEQIALCAEEIFVEELKRFITQHSASSINDGAIISNIGGEQRITRMGLNERRQVQDNLPNLWALTTALLAKTDTLHQDARRERALDVIGTLCIGQIQSIADHSITRKGATAI